MDNNFVTYPILNGFSGVMAFTTLKQTLGEDGRPRFTGNPESVVVRSRKKLAEALNIDPGQLVFPRQTHTSSVACLDEMPTKELRETDALVTNQPGVCLCVQTADCVPILLYDPITKAAGAVHAGWRGTVGRIAGEAIATLKHRFFSAPENIRAVIGPSIGPDVYEVGDEVVEAVLESIPNPEDSLKIHPSGKYHLNLWEANRQVLISSGILADNIEISGYCTYSQEQMFFSARRESIETGRLVSGIMLLNR